MAADTHEADHDAEAYLKGTQEITEQVATWNLFMGLSKWGSLSIAVAVLLFTMWFMPNGGFFPALIASVVLAVAGWWFLRSKPADH
ncbi:aa3-type cytochrome c oxidase subunit IV [Brevundimonas sp.]|uniref:aa3-type cytochrome c oxidase subunit IV n=1 Tax=Brevundimonas sp. TaxID=1871086 RepID=UPI001E137701|nr:aa3-type cytochrome c oxidase subunit IV [Brevundimonas sp.]MBA3999592.1 aa3-type cytochrome c oxidase subunit IV [Brevundimonas sp.]